jgi:hypothetical protein
VSWDGQVGRKGPIPQRSQKAGTAWHIWVCFARVRHHCPMVPSLNVSQRSLLHNQSYECISPLRTPQSGKPPPFGTDVLLFRNLHNFIRISTIIKPFLWKCLRPGSWRMLYCLIKGVFSFISLFICYCFAFILLPLHQINLALLRLFCVSCFDFFFG